MRCPVCDDQSLAISSREGVEIDYCPQCRGVWLDRGELDKILDRAAPGGGGGGMPAAAPAPPPQREQPYREDDRDRDRYRSDDRDPRRKKRRSFLDDLFDFD